MPRLHRPCLLLAATVAVGLATLTPAAQSAHAPTTAGEWAQTALSHQAFDDACAEVMFVGVRGSGEAQGLDDQSGMGRAVRTIRDGVKTATGDRLRVRQYSLEYPAYPIFGADDGSSLVGGLVGAAAQVAAGHGDTLMQPPYFANIDIGVIKLRAVVQDSLTRCPGERVVLAGYSSGAMVVHELMAELGERPELAAAVVVADPARDLLLEGNVADHGLTYGSARRAPGLARWAVELPVFADFVDELDIDVPYLSPEVRAKTFDVCDLGDVVCAPVDLTSLDNLASAAVSVHSEYGKAVTETQSDASALAQVGHRVGDRLTGAVPGAATVGELVSQRSVTVDTGYWSMGAGRATATPDNQLIFTDWTASALAGTRGAIRRFAPEREYPFDGVGWGSRVDGTDLSRDVAVDEFGNVYTSYFHLPPSRRYDDGLPYLSKYSRDGRKIAVYPLQDQIGRHPNTSTSVDVDRQGRIYVLAHSTVFRYAANGEFLGSFAVSADASDLTFDAAGNLYLLNTYSLGKPDPTVSKRSADGTWTATYAALPRGGDNLESDSTGTLYVGGSGWQQSIVRVTPSAGDPAQGVVDQIPVPGAVGGNGFANSIAVAVGRDDRVYGIYEEPGPANGNWVFLQLDFGDTFEDRTFDVVGAPSIADEARAGAPVPVDAGHWSPEPAGIDYQWSLDGVAVEGATYSTFTPAFDDIGRFLTVTVTARRPGYLTTSRTSQGVYVAEAAPQPVPPAAPTGVTARALDAAVRVSWAGSLSEGSPVTGYTVTASPGGATHSVPAQTLATTVPGLTNGTTYTFTVTATSAAGESLPSSASNPATPAGLPGAPTRPAATRGDRQVSITWTKPSGNGAPVTGYTVTAFPGGVTRTVTGGDTLGTVMTGLTNGTAYTFAVSATNAVGTGAPSPRSAGVAPAGRPGPVARPTAKVVRGKVTIRWQAPFANGAPITRYRLDINKGRDLTLSGRTRAATVKGLRSGRYTFRVLAINAAGSSIPSPVVSVRVR